MVQAGGTRTTPSFSQEVFSALEVGFEAQELPSEKEPDKADASQREGNVVQPGPDPAAGGAPTANGVEHHENCADDADDAQKAEEDDPGRERVESGDAVGERNGDNPADGHDEEQDANQAGQETLAAFVGAQF